MTPETIARAGALARWGTMLNAATTVANHAAAEDWRSGMDGQIMHRPGVHAPIEEGIRRRRYSDRLTELCDLTGRKLEYWER